MAVAALLVMIFMTQTMVVTLASFLPHEFSAYDICGMDKQGFDTEPDYNRNMPPSRHTNVSLSLFINRVSAVDENKEEISLDVFLQVYWEDSRIEPNNSGRPFVELPWSQRHCIWMPDLYIRQLREMRVLSVFHEMTSVRLYQNNSMRVSIGATIIIKCDMDFVLYPLDVQNCAVDFTSYKYTAQEISFNWLGDSPVSFPSDFGNGFRLPRYVVSFSTDGEKRLIHYGEGNHSTARLLITMSREVRSYLLESYLPSSLFVIMSWGSFCVMPEIVPGRMVLLVTTLLSLVTMFDTVRNNSPDALELKCIEVWLISCTLFVFLALLEYFLVLFGIRYDKAWRRRRPPQPQPPPAPPPPASPNNGNHVQPAIADGVAVTEVARSGVFAQARIVPTERNALTALTLTTEEPHDAMKQQLAAQCIQRDSPVLESFPMEDEAGASGCARVSSAISRAILFCGSQRGTLDKFALMLFPLSFVIFTTSYWMVYLNAAHRQMRK